jgi:MoaA/NifB/PqqE/SkfB family radical SAM enzyme
MTLPVALPDVASMVSTLRDYLGYVRPFLAIVRPRALVPVMLGLKTVEYSIYRWHRPNVLRSYDPPEVRELTFKITNRCTDRCEKCGIWRLPDPELVSIDAVERSIVSLQGHVGHFTITGGEPLLFRSAVLRLARLAASINLPTTVVTNGLLADEGFLLEYAPLGHTLVISIDTIDRTRWAKFRGRDHYEQVFENLELAARLLGPRLHLQSVSAAESEGDLAGVAEYCRSRKLPHHVQPWTDFGGGWRPVANHCVRLQSSCEAWKNVAIQPNGDVVRCFDHHRLPEAREPLGNLERDSIGAILARARTREVTLAMKDCRLPCGHLACNASRTAFFGA